MTDKTKGDIMAVLKSKVAKIVYACVAAFMIFMCGSWVTNQTLKQNLDGYKNYTISQVIGNELNKTGGVNQQLVEIKSLVVQIKDQQDKTNDSIYQNWIVDINKYYKWSDGKHDSMLTSDYVDKMSNYWVVLPDKYKTDIVKAHYDYAFAYIQKVCK